MFVCGRFRPSDEKIDVRKKKKAPSKGRSLQLPGGTSERPLILCLSKYTENSSRLQGKKEKLLSFVRGGWKLID